MTEHLAKKMQRIKKKIRGLKEKVAFSKAGIVVGVRHEELGDDGKEKKEWFTIRKNQSKRNKTYVHKKLNSWNTNDFSLYFSDEYERRFKVPHGQILQAHRGLMKRLLGNYPPKLLLKGINYLLEHYNTLGVSTPTIQILWGFRQTIFMKAQNPEKTGVIGDKKQLMKEIDAD